MPAPNEISAAENIVVAHELAPGKRFAAMCALPWLAISGVYLESCAVRLSRGQWPRTMGNESYNVAIELFHMCVWLLLIAAAIATPVAGILGSLYQRYRLGVALFALGIGIIVLTHHFDPGRIWEWFLD
jgi:hypothetical protein